MSVHSCSVNIPRSEFSIREVARAGSVWRAFQDVAVSGSIAAGWPPQRYVDEGSAWVIRRMLVVHFAQIEAAQPLLGETWISENRRNMVNVREVRVSMKGRIAAAASQEWVHVDRNLRLCVAPQNLVDAFPTATELDAERARPLSAPEYELVPTQPMHRFAFQVWHTWMDPLGHVNHPAYVDWCDEALAQIITPHSLQAVDVVPVAEQLQYRSGATAPEEVVVTTEWVGSSQDAVVLKQRCESKDGRVFAEATLWRKLRQQPKEALEDALKKSLRS